jgi:hypothetical protein
MAAKRSEARIMGKNFVVPSLDIALQNGAYSIQVYDDTKRWDPDVAYHFPVIGEPGPVSDDPLPLTSIYSGFVENKSVFDDFGSDDIKVGIFSISNTLNPHPLDLLPRCKNFLFMYPSYDWWMRNASDEISYDEQDRPFITGDFNTSYEDFLVKRGELTSWFTYTLDEIFFMTGMGPLPRGLYQGWFFVSDLPLGRTSVHLQTLEHSMNDYTRIANSFHRWSENISKPALLVPRYLALESYGKRNGMTVKYFDDSRVHGSLNGIPVSVSGHAINMMFNAHYGLIDFRRWLLSVENNILRFLDGKQSSVSSSKTSEAVALFNQARKDGVLIFDDVDSVHGLWHSYYDYVLAVEAIGIISEMFGLPPPDRDWETTSSKMRTPSFLA